MGKRREGRNEKRGGEGGRGREGNEGREGCPLSEILNTPLTAICTPLLVSQPTEYLKSIFLLLESISVVKSCTLKDDVKVIFYQARHIYCHTSLCCHLQDKRDDLNTSGSLD